MREGTYALIYKAPDGNAPFSHPFVNGWYWNTKPGHPYGRNGLEATLRKLEQCRQSRPNWIFDVVRVA